MSSNEWLPAQIPFDLVRRGFAPDQVTAHLERLEYDLRIATANSDATNQRLSEITAHLSAVQADADELRAQLDRMALEPVSMTGLSNRMQRMIRLAEEEAAEIRARANADADQLKAVAAAMATAADRVCSSSPTGCRTPPRPLPPSGRPACGCSTTSHAAARPVRRSTSFTRGTPAACWSSWSNRRRQQRRTVRRTALRPRGRPRAVRR